MSRESMNRRNFLCRTALQAATGLIGAQTVLRGAEGIPVGPEFTLTTISGVPRERGRQYGRQFKDSIQSFLDEQFYQAFTGKPATKDEMLRYAGRCANSVKQLSPIVLEEMEGMAEGSDLSLEEIVLMSLHEELYHQGALPSVDHCHVAAAGPPATTGDTYVGQTWDWMSSVYGLSTMLRWERPEGPSVLAYGYPGMWIGAGLNSAGVAHCWTSAALGNNANLPGPRVGVPSYALIAHLLYQESLEAVAEEAQRDLHAGWFMFVFADGEGNLLNIDGSPEGVAVEQSRGIMVRHNFGTRKMNKTPPGQPTPLHGQCPFMLKSLEAGEGKLDESSIRGVLADDHVGGGALDLMVFNTTQRIARVSRGPGSRVKWQTFGFSG